MLSENPSAYPEDVIAPAQIRAARALLNWSQKLLAEKSGVSEVAIKNLERGATDPRLSTINHIQAAFDKAGVIFLDAGDVRDGGPGVRMRANLPKAEPEPPAELTPAPRRSPLS